MSDVAERAEVSTATAYRHFASVDDILAQFRFDVGERLLAYSRKCDDRGLTKLERICEEWVRLVVKHGGTMVHTRSEEGYLARLRAGAPYLVVQAEALLPAIAEASLELGIDDPGDEALFLWNMMFDPREIFDVLKTLGMDEARASKRLFTAFCGAVVGWQRGRVDSTAEIARTV